LAQLIYILSTGGTMEKAYSERTGQVENLDAKVDRYLSQLRLPDLQIEAVRLMNKDSLEMTADDRELVLLAVKTKLSKPAPIVITHGTDTMVETGLHLQRHLPALPVPIVMTGAMTPLGFERSDGLQNLTESLMAARILAPGVWLVMHGQVFPIGETVKDREKGTFVRKPDLS
jgi:L-asparaginase